MQDGLNDVEGAPKDFDGRGSLPLRCEGIGGRGDHIVISNCLFRVQCQMLHIRMQTHTDILVSFAVWGRLAQLWSTCKARCRLHRWDGKEGAWRDTYS